MKSIHKHRFVRSHRIISVLKKMTCAAVFSALLFGGSLAHAASFSFTGSFAADDDVQLFNFSVGASSTVILRTYSYAGGTNAAGNTIARGGFDPILSLFDSTGTKIGDNDDGFAPNVAMDSVTGATFDTYFTSVLGAGSYTVAITQFNNFAPATLGGAFGYSGSPFFTAAYGCSNGQFCDAVSDNRTNQWAFDLLNVNAASVSVVPIPATLPLFLSGLVAFGVIANRKRKKAVA